jgi:hypothetical protein
MANKLSDREYVKQLLDDMEGKTNHMKAKAIARLFGGRIRQRLRERDTPNHSWADGEAVE